jgi:hypothetical protein
MDMTVNKEKTFPVWINHTDKVVSFEKTDGFEILYFSSYKETIDFAIEKCSVGYRIQ